MKVLYNLIRVFFFEYFHAFIMMPITLDILFFTSDIWLVKLSFSSLMTPRHLGNWLFVNLVVPS